MSGHDYTLYSYFRSSSSARLRITLNLKSLHYDLIPVNLIRDEHLSDAHRALNPSGSVPLLVCHTAHREDFKIGQSVAAIEYLDEVHPDTPLLPPVSDPEARAAVRTLVQIISSDTQPVTNLRVMRKVRTLGGDAEEWNREFMREGLRAYQTVAQEWAGKYSVGDNITMADACFMPAWWNAQRFGVDLTEFGLLGKVAEALEEHSAVIAAGYGRQPDTPEEMRVK
ncbi:probable maleylacetoacetate isomerase [Cephalotrichum gorgonifer]|uniref:Probable maleylacetoacetate isomerase n=1 Tax=Cephalotrichum gorgonifer TaxID=2041049 RepID=A0AAE8N1U6_9PEZI|nr:probable maleylacetoacetate isomerase [Cephalotrichum gorgonifer]